MSAGIFQAIRAPQAQARRTLGASRLIVIVAILAFGATIMTAGVGYSLARQSDERLWVEQRTALRAAISEFRALFGQTEDLDPRFVRTVQRSVNIPGLAYETEPSDGRETQPVIDGGGRIVGFFTWQKTHPMMDAMNRLLPLIAGMTVVLVGFAAFSLWQLRRARRELAASEELARRAADEDKLTGLPNHAKMLELLDLALAERTEEEVVTFALFEVDGMDDVTAHHGVLGSDELIVAVAGRLKEALPEHAVCGRIGADEFAILLTSGAAVDSEAVLHAGMVAFMEGAMLYGVFHGDLHGGNLMVQPDGRTVLMDFGITGRLDEPKRLAFMMLLVGGTTGDTMGQLRSLRDLGAFPPDTDLDKVFTDFGAEWRFAGCSMCLGMNPDQLAPGERCASTSNRNFEGRQGKGGRTHLVSPLVAAATAVRGTLSSPSDLDPLPADSPATAGAEA